jgi:hypothetical protein
VHQHYLRVESQNLELGREIGIRMSEPMMATKGGYCVSLLRLLAAYPNGEADVENVLRDFLAGYRDRIPAHHFESLENKPDEERWSYNVRKARRTLLRLGFMDLSHQGAWQISNLGRAWLAQNPNTWELDLRAYSFEKPRSPGTPSTTDERDDFFARVIDRVQEHLLRVGISGLKPNTWPHSHTFQLRMDDFPGSHYEVAIHRSTYEIGLHFESSQTQSLQRLAAFQPHVEHLSALFGEPINAEVWRDRWGRVYVEHSLQDLDWDDVNGFGERVGRFIELTYPILREAYAGATGSRGRSVAALPEIHAILDAEVDAVRQFLLGRSTRPSDERLCDLVHLCYTFALYAEATQLFNLVDPGQVNPWYYERTKRLAKICALRL